MGSQFAAEISIENFDNKRHFATFSPSLRRLLRAYHNSRRSDEDGLRLLQNYGQFVVTRGLFGGYFRARSVLSASAVAASRLSESSLKQCFEVAVSAEASGFGFSGSASAEVAGCDARAQSALRESKNSFMQDTQTTEFFGGKVSGGEFDVTPESAELLTQAKLYPRGKQLELRLLSDFFKADRVSPVEYAALGLEEEDFDKIHRSRERLTRRVLQSASGVLSRCDCPNGISTLNRFTLGRSVRDTRKSITCTCNEQVEPTPAGPVEVKVTIPGTSKTLTLCEVDLFDAEGRQIRMTNAAQSSTAFGGLAARAIDGNRSSRYFDGSCTHTALAQTNPSWTAELSSADASRVAKVVIQNRSDCCSERLFGVQVFIGGNRIDNVDVRA
jgi:hypothetical protein